MAPNSLALLFHCILLLSSILMAQSSSCNAFTGRVLESLFGRPSTQIEKYEINFYESQGQTDILARLVDGSDEKLFL